MISVLRILLVPVLIGLILAEDRAASVVAAVIFVVGAMSDGLDGYLARRYDAKTRTGAWLDPLADKVFVAATGGHADRAGHVPVVGHGRSSSCGKWRSPCSGRSSGCAG